MTTGIQRGGDRVANVQESYREFCRQVIAENTSRAGLPDLARKVYRDFDDFTPNSRKVRLAELDAVRRAVQRHGMDWIERALRIARDYGRPAVKDAFLRACRHLKDTPTPVLRDLALTAVNNTTLDRQLAARFLAEFPEE